MSSTPVASAYGALDIWSTSLRGDRILMPAPGTAWAASHE